MFLYLSCLLVFDLFVFFEIDSLLLLLLGLLLSIEEVSDEFVEAVVLGLTELFALDLLLVMNEHVVAVRLLDALIQFHLSQHLCTVKGCLIFFQLPLQFFLFKQLILFLIVVQYTRVVRRTSTCARIGCACTNLI
jgi:hypothetical protein